MFAESGIPFSVLVTFVAVVMCVLSMGGIVWTAGRWRGNFDGLARRMEVSEKCNSKLTEDVYDRLGEIDKSLVSLNEQVSFIRSANNNARRSRAPPGGCVNEG